MFIKEYLAKDSQNKNRVFVDIECDSCKAVYSRQKRHVSSTHGCSPKCLNIIKGTTVTVDCAHCGKTHQKRKSSADRSKSGLYFCSQECHNIGATYIEQVRPAHYQNKNYRAIALRNLPHQCSRCGYNNILALEVHHKDRNRDNNLLSNLEILCANCHSIEHKTGELYGTAS